MGQGKAHFCKSLHEQYNLTKESSYWEIEKASLKELLELLEEELQTIDEKLNSVEKENSAGEEERIKLADENEDLKAAILPVSETLEKLESQILYLVPRLRVSP